MGNNLRIAKSNFIRTKFSYKDTQKNQRKNSMVNSQNEKKMMKKTRDKFARFYIFNVDVN